jgi:hypothetical protein
MASWRLRLASSIICQGKPEDATFAKEKKGRKEKKRKEKCVRKENRKENRKKKERARLDAPSCCHHG